MLRLIDGIMIKNVNIQPTGMWLSLSEVLWLTPLCSVVILTRIIRGLKIVFKSCNDSFKIGEGWDSLVFFFPLRSTDARRVLFVRQKHLRCHTYKDTKGAFEWSYSAIRMRRNFSRIFSIANFWSFEVLHSSNLYISTQRMNFWVYS